jgi:hypothetical protein
MGERDTAIANALRDVWFRHREAVIADLAELVGALTRWNEGTRSDELAHQIRVRSHRIRGSLTMVGRTEVTDALGVIEARSDDEDPYAKEAVDRIHDLLEHLRMAD